MVPFMLGAVAEVFFLTTATRVIGSVFMDQLPNKLQILRENQGCVKEK